MQNDPSAQRLANGKLLGVFGLILVLFVVDGCAEERKSSGLPAGLKLVNPSIPSSVMGPMRTVNEIASRGLVPEENCAVWLTQLLGGEFIPMELREPTFQMLGISSLAPEGPRLLELSTFLTQGGQKTAVEQLRQSEEVSQGVAEGSSRLWEEREFPAFGAYLKANELSLNTIAIAVQKPRYYMPLLSVEDPPRLLSASFGLELRLVYLTKLLVSRAMLRVSSDDLEGAMQDLLAARRLASQLVNGSLFDVSLAKGGLLDSLAQGGEQKMIESGKLSAEQAIAYREALELVPVFPSSATVADFGERAILRQEIELLKTDPDLTRTLFEVHGEEKPKEEKPQPLPMFKWDLAIQTGDEFQDRMVQALKTRDRKEQDEAFWKLELTYEAFEKTAEEKTRKMAEAIAGDLDIDAASRWIGESISMAVRPNFRQRRAMDDRTATRRDLIRVALGLVAFKQKTGDYPQELSELSPQYLKTIPLDSNTDAPFAYSHTGKGEARVMTLGNNQKDDAGQGYNDDQIIRLK